MSIANNVVGLPVTISELATLLSASNTAISVCLASKINKWSAIKPVDLNRDSHTTFSGMSDINFGLISNAISVLVDRAAAKPTFSAWTYRKPQGGSTSPCRLGDFCVYDGTTQKGYKHNSQLFMEAKNYDLDVTNGGATLFYIQCMMNGKRIAWSANSADNINIDLKDLSLDYKSTSDYGVKITEANRRLTCGYWRFGLAVYIPHYYQDSTGADIKSGGGVYLCCAKDTITTDLQNKTTTQFVKFDYGCDNALYMMKRAMLCDSSNTYFEALPVLVFNAQYNEDTGKWSTDAKPNPDKIITFPNTGYIKLNMTNMITIDINAATPYMNIGGTNYAYQVNTSVTPPILGFVISKSAWKSPVTTTLVIKASVPSGDTIPSGENVSVYINGYGTANKCSCTFSGSSTSSSGLTCIATWTTTAITAFAAAISAAGTDPIAYPVRIEYTSSMKGALVRKDLTIQVYVK